MSKKLSSTQMQVFWNHVVPGRIIYSQMLDFWRQVAADQINYSQMQGFLTQVGDGPITRQFFQQFLENLDAPRGECDSFITRPKSVEGILERLIAKGQFDWVSYYITSERFPVTVEPNPDEELVVVHLDEELTPKQVIVKLDEKGLVPAEIEYLLVYKAKNPDEQRKYPIIGLGSPCHGDHGSRNDPFLNVTSDGYALSRYFLGWDTLCDKEDRFLARRKPVSSVDEPASE